MCTRIDSSLRALIRIVLIAVMVVGSASCSVDGPHGISDGLDGPREPRLRVTMPVDSTAGYITALIRTPFIVTRAGQPVSDLPVTITSSDTNVVRAALFAEPPQSILSRLVGLGVARVIVSVEDGTERAADTLIIRAN